MSNRPRYGLNIAQLSDVGDPKTSTKMGAGGLEGGTDQGYQPNSGTSAPVGSQSNPYQGGEVEVTAPKAGADVMQKPGSRYNDNATGEIVSPEEMQKRSSSNYNTPPGHGYQKTEGNPQGNQQSYSEMKQNFKSRSKGRPQFEPVVEESVEANGKSVPIGDSGSGLSTASRTAFNKDASDLVAKEGTYDEMDAVANNSAGYSGSKDLNVARKNRLPAPPRQR